MSFLNLFGGDSSTSTSSTQQITDTNNAASFATNGANSSAIGINGSNNNISQTFTNMDSAVAMRAMDNMLTMGQDAFLFGADQSTKAYNFASTSQRDSLNFADKQITSSQTTAQQAIGTAKEAYQQALRFGSQQTGVAIDSLSQSAQMLDKAYADAKGVLSENTITIAIVAGVAIMFFALRHK